MLVSSVTADECACVGRKEYACVALGGDDFEVDQCVLRDDQPDGDAIEQVQ